VVGYAFAGAFSVVRVFLGFSVTYFWALEIIQLLYSGKGHSDGVLYFYLIGASALSVLQAWWFILIAKAALGFGMSTDARKETKKTQ
jgi:hypothetical protein